MIRKLDAGISMNIKAKEFNSFPRKLLQTNQTVSKSTASFRRTGKTCGRDGRNTTGSGS